MKTFKEFLNENKDAIENALIMLKSQLQIEKDPNKKQAIELKIANLENQLSLMQPMSYEPSERRKKLDQYLSYPKFDPKKPWRDKPREEESGIYPSVPDKVISWLKTWYGSRPQ
jgi:hypothetical protein